MDPLARALSSKKSLREIADLPRSEACASPESGIRAILNHRPSADSTAGHYTVLVEVEAQDVVLHDPYYGPSRRVSHAELLELWQPGFSNSEIAGYILIAIAAEPPAAP